MTLQHVLGASLIDTPRCDFLCVFEACWLENPPSRATTFRPVWTGLYELNPAEGKFHHDLTVLPSPGNHMVHLRETIPLEMAELFRLVNYYNLHRSTQLGKCEKSLRNGNPWIGSSLNPVALGMNMDSVVVGWSWQIARSNYAAGKWIL